MLHQEVVAGPFLSDGAPVSSLIDRERRQINLRVLSDPDIYRLELDRLWSKAWVLVGLDSELPNAGDFVTRMIGADEILLVRQRDGSVACMLNVCPHRAMQVCRTSRGNASSFRCIYHGWTYGPDGVFRGAPFDQEMRPQGFDRAARSMLRARVELFGGLIFVNWSEDAPPLAEFLGDIGPYLRMIYDRSERGFEVLGPPQRYIINANWKVAAEQAAGDGYHTVSLHRAYVDLGFFGDMKDDARSWGQIGVKVSSGGHCLKFHDFRHQFAGKIRMAGTAGLSALDKLRTAPPAGMPADQVEDFAARFSAEEIALYADQRPGVGGLFPNVHVIAYYAPDPEGVITGSFAVHTFTPRGPNQFEFMHWNLVERGASEAFRQTALRAATFNMGVSGVVETDDSEVWPAQQRSAQGVIAQRLRLNYDIVGQSNRPADWVGGGQVQDGFNSDDSQWNWWTTYFDYLLGDAGASA